MLSMKGRSKIFTRRTLLEDLVLLVLKDSLKTFCYRPVVLKKQKGMPRSIWNKPFTADAWYAMQI